MERSLESRDQCQSGQQNMLEDRSLDCRDQCQSEQQDLLESKSLHSRDEIPKWTAGSVTGQNSGQ